MTWYVACARGRAAVDTSEAYGVCVVLKVCETGDELAAFASAGEISALVWIGELWETGSTGGELVAFASTVAISVLVALGELCEATSTDDELVIVASPLGVCAVLRFGELCAAGSTSGELVVIAPAVAGVGDPATDRVFG